MQMSVRFEAAVRASSTKVYERLRQIGKHPKGDYLDISTKGTISYLPTNRFDKVTDVYGDVGKRVAGKPIKILKAFLEATDLPEPWITPETFDFLLNNLENDHFCSHNERASRRQELSDRDWELFLYAFETYSCDLSDINFRLVKGKDIRKYYHENMITKKKSLPNLYSCMSHNHTQHLLDIYVELEKCSLLLQLDEDGKVMGRALVWSLDSGETFMDRVYGDESTTLIFRRYAVEQGWLYRTHNSYYNPMEVTKPDGENTRMRMSIQIPHYFEKFPYMDTFHVLGRNKNENDSSTYFLSNADVVNAARTLRSTNG